MHNAICTISYVCAVNTHICQALGSVLSGSLAALSGGLSSLGDVPRVDDLSGSDSDEGKNDKKGSKGK